MNESTSAVPKVSVIIPLYNKAPYIKRALDSVLAQTVQDFEIVVVNDGSTDGGEKIVEELNDSRIRLINQKNQGVSAARNNGVDAAKAELVAFLDADDEWLPEFLETILRLREKWPEAGLYGTGFSVINVSGSQYKRVVEAELGDHLIQNWFAKKNKYGGQIVLTSAMAIPKNIYQNIGGFPVDAIQNEDRYLRARIALCYPVAYSPDVCAVYYIDNSTYNARFKKYLTDPFSKYVEDEQGLLIIRNDFADICEFCDTERYWMSIINQMSNHNKLEIKNEIKKIHSKRLFVEKTLLLLSIMLPRTLSLVIIKLISIYHITIGNIILKARR